MTTAMLLSLLVALPAQSDDPEPPTRKGFVTRLVAKKSTYKLDFGGKKKLEYVKGAKQGSEESPKVQLELVITNYTKETVRIRSAGSNTRLTLTLEGDGAISTSVTTEAVRVKIGYTILQPKEKMTIPIDRLASVERVLKGEVAEKRHYWTEPGDYKVKASFSANITTDFNGVNPFSRFQTFDSQAVTLKVEK